MVDLLPRMVDILDEPIGDPAAINTLLMSEAARAAGVKVLLSGMGADELFGGYRKHVACVLAGRYRELPAFVHRSTNGVVGRLPVTAAGRGLRYARWAKRFVTFAELPEEAAFRRSYSLYAPAELAALLNPESAPDVDDVIEQHLQVYEDNLLSRRGQPHVSGGYPTVSPWSQPCLHRPSQHGRIDRSACAVRGSHGLPGHVLPGRQGEGLREKRKGRVEACRPGLAPERDRAPTQGVLLGTAPSVGDTRPADVIDDSLLEGELVGTGFLEPASRQPCSSKTTGRDERTGPSRSGSCLRSSSGTAKPVEPE